MLLEISGEITPKRMKGWSQSKNNTQLWMWLVIEARSNAVKSNTALEPGTFLDISYIQFSSVESLSHVRFFATPWITACQASLSITNSWSSLKLMPIDSVMPSSHLILCHPLLLLPPVLPSIRVFSNESALTYPWLSLPFFSEDRFLSCSSKLLS